MISETIFSHLATMRSTWSQQQELSSCNRSVKW